MTLIGVAGDEAGEQRDVGVGDGIVADPSVAAVADVVFGHEAGRMDVPLHDVGRRALAQTPMLMQTDGRIDANDGGDRLVERFFGDVRCLTKATWR